MLKVMGALVISSFLFIRNFLLINKNVKIKESGYNATPKRFISL